MLKVLSLLKRKEGMTREEFYNWAMNEHVKFGPQLPNIRAYRMSAARLDEAEAPFDAIAEMWFDDVASFDAAFATPQGQQARADAMSHASQRVHIRTEEKILI